MRLLRSSRRRRTFVAACLPYLLLSLFVDFVHLHPLLRGDVPQITTTAHVGACTPERTKTHDTQCAVCQWLRSDVGLQTSVTDASAIALLPGRVVPSTSAIRGSPARLAIDPRGPPLPRFV